MEVLTNEKLEDWEIGRFKMDVSLSLDEAQN